MNSIVKVPFKFEADDFPAKDISGNQIDFFRTFIANPEVADDLHNLNEMNNEAFSIIHSGLSASIDAFELEADEEQSCQRGISLYEIIAGSVIKDGLTGVLPNSFSLNFVNKPLVTRDAESAYEESKQAMPNLYEAIELISNKLNDSSSELAYRAVTMSALTRQLHLKAIELYDQSTTMVFLDTELRAAAKQNKSKFSSLPTGYISKGAIVKASKNDDFSSN